MRNAILLLFALGAPAFPAQYLWQFYSDTVVKWTIVEHDEFNSDRLDENKWHLGFPWGKALMSQRNYVFRSNLHLGGGAAAFITKPLDSLIALSPYEIDSNYLRVKNLQLTDGNKLNFDYSTALLWSKRTFKYGYFEIKFKGVRGQGIWPAFWLYGGNPNYEIDFYELKGEREKALHVDVHCPEGCANYKENRLGYRKGWGHWINTDKKLFDTYNVVSGEWSENGIKWFLNGQLIAISFVKMDIPMSLVVGTGVATKDGPFNPGANSRTPFPNLFIVDYIRVYGIDSLTTGHTPGARYARADYSVNPEPGAFGAAKTRSRVRDARNRAAYEPMATISISASDNGFIFRRSGAINGAEVGIYFLTDQGIIQHYASTSNEEREFRYAGINNLSIKIEAGNKVVTQQLSR